jgi:hypothetical protein
MVNGIKYLRRHRNVIVQPYKSRGITTGIIYAEYRLADDLSVVRDTRVYPYMLLGIALFIALGFWIRSSC